MREPIAPSSCVVARELDVVRDCPRPRHLRNDTFYERFDWRTLFYDVYRHGEHVVLQGPPLFNFLPLLRESEPFYSAFRGLFPRARHVSRHKRGEIWLKSPAERIAFDGPLGAFDVAVQPSGAELFAGKRVLLAISKNNAPRWIEDWLRFHHRIHGADALLLYDNGSTDYDAAALEASLAEKFPAVTVRIVRWAFPYGPSGGRAGAVDGVEPDWDSDFCQTGMLQHARFRFLPRARSVLSVDIDELVLGTTGRSVFEAAETAPGGLVKFEGRWISTANPRLGEREACRHAHFTLRDPADGQPCPAKWCAVPGKVPAEASWTVHNLFGVRANKRLSTEFAYRHMRAISTSWKYDRWERRPADLTHFVEDGSLARAFHQAGIAAD